MKNIFVLLCAILPFITFAQGENDNWYFGGKAAVNFSSSTPVVLNNSQMSALEACGTASDTSGHLLFYTDGQYVWNRNHQVMQNGDMLGGSFTSQQLAIVQHPTNPKQYFIFTGGMNDTSVYANTIAYSIVDMSLGNLDVNGIPLGRVLDSFKKVAILDNLGNKFKSEAITTVPGPNNTFWVLIPNKKKLYTYVVNSSGFINGAPVISNLDFPAQILAYNHFGIKASPRLNGNPNFSNYICISSWANPNYNNKICSFDDVTGQVTNHYSLIVNSINSYSSEFNKLASVLYLGYQKIYAVDLLTSIPGSINYTEIYSMNFGSYCGAIQRNKHDDIYVGEYNSNFLGKIINPDVYGPGISVDMNNINLGTDVYGSNLVTQLGLPQLLPGKRPYIPPPCISDTLLVNPETNMVYTYQVSNTIITKDKYTVFPRQNITMKGGKSVTLLPNTFIMNGAIYLAEIDGCTPFFKQQTAERKGLENISMSLDLDENPEQAKDILVYPNPTSNWVTIDTRSQKLLYWELYDITGKLVLKGNTNRVKVSGLPSNVYLLHVGLANGIKAHQKLIVQ